jgi:hypothetical protein
MNHLVGPDLTGDIGPAMANIETNPSGHAATSPGTGFVSNLVVISETGGTFW